MYFNTHIRCAEGLFEGVALDDLNGVHASHGITLVTSLAGLPGLAWLGLAVMQTDSGLGLEPDCVSS